MLLTILKGKLHKACVNQCDLHYEGSVSIDQDLMDSADIFPNEQVDVLNINSGHRFTTYAIPAKRGSKLIGINGAAARLVQPGDRVIIIAYCQMNRQEALAHHPKIIRLNQENHILDS